MTVTHNIPLNTHKFIKSLDDQGYLFLISILKRLKVDNLIIGLVEKSREYPEDPVGISGLHISSTGRLISGFLGSAFHCYSNSEKKEVVSALFECRRKLFGYELKLFDAFLAEVDKDHHETK